MFVLTLYGDNLYGEIFWSPLNTWNWMEWFRVQVWRATIGQMEYDFLIAHCGVCRMIFPPGSAKGISFGDTSDEGLKFNPCWRNQSSACFGACWASNLVILAFQGGCDDREP